MAASHSPPEAAPTRRPPLRVYTAAGEAADLQEMLDAEDVEFLEVDDIDEVRVVADPAVLFLSRGLLGRGGTHESLGALPTHIVVVAADDGARSAADQAGRLFLAAPDLAPGEAPLLRALRSATRHAEAEAERERMGGSAEAARARLTELNRIGMALMSERDPDTLLEMILTQARRLASADAGSLYLVERREDGADGEQRHLRFLRAQNDTLPDLPAPDFELPVSPRSMAGWVASTGESLVVDDVYDLPDTAPYSFDGTFDERAGYRARSMLTVPMVDYRDRVVGVIQLINRMRTPGRPVRTESEAAAHVEPFRPQDVQVVQSLAGQAAVSVENGRLHRSIEALLEGFIRAAGTAIDRRDPTTSGHSVRVTELTCALAERMNALDEGPFADVRFDEAELKQLRYAGLLHDFGKVAVPEAVLVKQRKLPPDLETEVEARFEVIRAALERDAARARAEAADRGAPAAEVEAIVTRLAADLERLESDRETIRRANRPQSSGREVAGRLKEIAARRWVDAAGRERPYLTPEEVAFLSIERGSLDPEERRQIEGHVLHSCDFLAEIPWTEELARISEIVRGHHEKLDGSGYPDGVSGDAIPLETRIMTVCDIFDALTASDRPYREAMPVDRALDILRSDAEQGALDPDVVELFVTSRIYERVLGVDWRRL